MNDRPEGQSKRIWLAHHAVLLARQGKFTSYLDIAEELASEFSLEIENPDPLKGLIQWSLVVAGSPTASQYWGKLIAEFNDLGLPKEMGAWALSYLTGEIDASADYFSGSAEPSSVSEVMGNPPPGPIFEPALVNDGESGRDITSPPKELNVKEDGLESLNDDATGAPDATEEGYHHADATEAEARSRAEELSKVASQRPYKLNPRGQVLLEKQKARDKNVIDAAKEPPLEGEVGVPRLVPAPSKSTSGAAGEPNDILIAEARQLILDGEVGDAVAKYAKLVSRGKLVDVVIAELHEALGRHPVEVSLWQTLGDAYTHQDMLQEALRSYDKASEILGPYIHSEPQPVRQPQKPAPKTPAWGCAVGGVALLALAGLALSGGLTSAPTQAPTPLATSTGSRTPTPTLTPSPTSTLTPTVASTPTPEPTSTATLGVGSSFINPVDGARLLFVPAGDFRMGSNDGDSDEQPVHTVYLDDYWMYETEVTNAQFAQFVVETGHANMGTSDDGMLSDHPVVFVNWSDAVAYCEWAGMRLPTEAEWEKAARSDDGRMYPWGNTWDSNRANGFGTADGYKRTSPVGSFPGGASPYGLLDTAGNVWEWVADWYASDYYHSSPRSNPQGPANGDYRVIRSGSWKAEDESVMATYFRLLNIPTDASENLGFRCAAAETTAPGSALTQFGRDWRGLIAGNRNLCRIMKVPAAGLW